VLVLSLLLVCVSCASPTKTISENRAVQQLRCLYQDPDNEIGGCVKWVSNVSSEPEMVEAFTDLLVILNNTGRLKTIDRSVSASSRVDIASTAFEKNFYLDIGTEITTRAKLNQLICSLNSSRSAYSKECRFNGGRPKKVDVEHDLLSHISGREILKGDQIRWQSSNFDQLFLPDLKFEFIPVTAIFENKSSNSLKQFISNNELVCRGHALSKTFDGNEYKATRDNFWMYDFDECVSRYLSDNKFRIGNVDDANWTSATFLVPQLSVVFKDRFYNDELDRLPNKLQSLIRKKKIPAGSIVDLLNELIPEQMGRAYNFEYESRGFASNALQLPTNSEVAAGSASQADGHVLAEKKAQFSSGYETYESNTENCFVAMFEPSILEKENQYSEEQKILFLELGHPIVDPYSSYAIELKRNLKRRWLEVVSKSPKYRDLNALRVGLLDSVLPADGACEVPSQKNSSMCGSRKDLRKEPILHHGLAVAAVAAAPIHLLNESEDGIIGVSPCATLDVVDFDWHNVAATSEAGIVHSLQNNVAQSDSRIWNLSGSWPRDVTQLKAAVDKKSAFLRNFKASMIGLEDLLFVASSGAVPPGTDFQECLIFPACFTNEKTGLAQAATNNVLAVIGVEKSGDGYKLWEYKDGDQTIQKSYANPRFDVAAIAGKAGSRLDTNAPIYPLSISTNQAGDGYVTPVEGISFAVPQVSATVALLSYIHEKTPPRIIKQRVTACSRFYNELKHDVFGGVLDIGCTLDAEADILVDNDNPSKAIRGTVVAVYTPDGGREWPSNAKFEVNVATNAGAREPTTIDFNDVFSFQRVDLYYPNPSGARSSDYAIFYSPKNQKHRQLRSEARFSQDYAFVITKEQTNELCWIDISGLGKFIQRMQTSYSPVSEARREYINSEQLVQALDRLNWENFHRDPSSNCTA